MALTADFLGDAVDIARSYLTSLGYSLPMPLSAWSILLMLSNLEHRVVHRAPRAIHVSTGFSCPPAQAAGLAGVKTKIQNGDDLRPHLSKHILKPDYQDAMLNDWGIYHLHLGTTLDQAGFVTRTGPVLFCRFTATDAYLIDVKQHGGKKQPWSDQTLIREIYANWPGTIARYELKGLFLAPDGIGPTDQEIAEARAAGVQPIIQIDGKPYRAFGGGIATDRSSIRALEKADRIREQLRNLEQQARALEPQWRVSWVADQLTVPDPVAVRLHREADGTLVASVGHGVPPMPIGRLTL